MTRQPHNPAPNVYLAAYRDFRAIPGAPWVYWIPEGIRRLFRDLPKLGDMAEPKHGLSTCDNFRFLRYWWEVGLARIAFDCRDRAEAQTTGRRWFPYTKGGAYRKWYGNQEYVVNWWKDGAEIKADVLRKFPYLRGNFGWVITNEDYYFREGVTWSKVTSGGFSIRYTPLGFVFDVAGTSVFPPPGKVFYIAGVLNSALIASILRFISPTVNYEVGHIASLPVLPTFANEQVKALAQQAIRVQVLDATLTEPTFDFIAPPRWGTGIDDLSAARARLRELEARIDEEVYRLYGIADEDRAAIEAELGTTSDADDDGPPFTREELAKRWVSYAVGIVMGRFRPGLPRTRAPHARGPLGRAVFHPEDFAVGSLPAPSPEEFDALVGSGPHPRPLSQRARGARFAYVDEQGGRHLFPPDVEQALRDLALPEGIAVVQAHHPLDLTARVQRALELMWGEAAAQEVIAAVGGDLARYLERTFWRDHLQTYRYRPIYWLLQSPRRALTVYLYHERVTRDTLFVVKTEIVAPTRRLLQAHLQEQEAQAAASSGRVRQRARKQAEALQAALDDLAAFAEALERVLQNGYEPDLDDGVLINLAPLYELVPWPRKKKVRGRSVSELEAIWRALEAGEYDWAHLAMRYWPDRVQQKAQNDPSLALAHNQPFELTF